MCLGLPFGCYKCIHTPWFFWSWMDGWITSYLLTICLELFLFSSGSLFYGLLKDHDSNNAHLCSDWLPAWPHCLGADVNAPVLFVSLDKFCSKISLGVHANSSLPLGILSWLQAFLPLREYTMGYQVRTLPHTWLNFI